MNFMRILRMKERQIDMHILWNLFYPIFARKIIKIITVTIQNVIIAWFLRESCMILNVLKVLNHCLVKAHIFNQIGESIQ